MFSEPPLRAMDRSVPAARRPVIAAAAGSMIFLAATGFAFAQTPAADPVIAKVNGVDIHQSDLTLAAEKASFLVLSRFRTPTSSPFAIIGTASSLCTFWLITTWIPLNGEFFKSLISIAR